MNTIAIYLRLSSEDKDKKESESIGNQRDLLLNYIKNDTALSKCPILEFVDDGYSGTNFDRPQVSKMLNMAGKTVNIILVKDFSRFGRNLTEVGNYLDQVFPFLGVRFIAVNENFDSDNYKGTTTSLDVGLKSFIYELYSKDLSQKSKAARTIMYQKGLYLHGFPPFGYMKSQIEKNRLVPNPETAPILQRIFKMALTGCSVPDITRTFNSEKIPSPRWFREKYGQPTDLWDKNAIDYYWNEVVIFALLRDERYFGRMVAGKVVRTSVGSKKRRKASEDEIITCENAHEPLVTKEDWERVQEMFPYMPKKRKNINKSPLTGIIKCGICSHCLLYRNSKIEPYYLCNTHKRVPDCKCKELRISSQKIIEEILEQVENKYPERETDRTTIDSRNNLPLQLKEIQNSLLLIDRKKESIFEKLADEKITVEVFSQESTILKLEKERLLLQNQEILEKSREITPIVETPITSTNTESLIKTYVKIVKVFPDKSFEIIWK